MPDTVLRFTAPLELTAAADKPPRVSITAYAGRVMTVAGFGPIVIDLPGLQLPANGLNILVDHAATLDGIAGHGMATATAGRLIVAGQLASTPAGAQVHNLLRSGNPLQASVGVELRERRFVAERESIAVNGQQLHGPFTLIKTGLLREVSIVAIGADAGTSVSLAARKGPSTMTTEIEVAVAADRQRLLSIDAACRVDGLPRDQVQHLRARAIGGELTLERLQAHLLEMIRSSRPSLPASHAGGRSPRQSGDMMVASLCLQHGVSERRAAEWYGEQTIDAAVSGSNRKTSLHSILRAVISADGGTPPQGRIGDADIRAAFHAERRLQASMGPSTLSLPGILGDFGNKLLLDSFNGTNVTWPTFCRVAPDAADFKPLKRFRLTGSGSFQEVGPGGELKHIALTESEFTNRLDTFGAIIALDRQAIINDDLSAFANIPRVLGRLGSIKLERTGFELLLSNPGTPAFFSTDHLNWNDGAPDSALDLTGLGAAYQLVVPQTDDNGDPICVPPKVLLVQPALGAAARALMNSVQIIDGTGTAAQANGNPWQGMFTPVVSPYLAVSAGLTGALDTSWYLLVGPSDFSILEVAFLQGKRIPTIESGELDFDRLGMSWRSFWDFGVAFLDHCGGVKSVGA